MKGRLLYRAILSHLVVAVPPAVGLGLLVVEINRQGLRLEAQQLHLSVAARVRDTLVTEIDRSVAALGHAERILDTDALPFEERMVILRALVAEGRISYIAVYTPDGRLDSTVKGERGEPPKTLAEKTQATARDRGHALAPPRFLKEPLTLVVVPWTRDGQIMGYLATDFEIFRLRPVIGRLKDRFLGKDGALHVFSADGRYLASTTPKQVGHPAGPHAPLPSTPGDSLGLASIAAGLSFSYADDQGHSRLASVVSEPALGWIVSVSRQSSVAFQSIEDVKIRTLLFAIVAALAAGLMGLFLARGVAEPVRRLAYYVRRSARRGFSEPVRVAGPNEVEALADSFNLALTELEKHREELRHRAHMQIRLSRYLSPSALHELMSQELLAQDVGQEETVTVLYADIAAQSELSERAPSGQMVELLGEFFACACQAVEAHGGKIDRYSGDAVIGVFPRSMVPNPIQAAFEAAQTIIRDAEALGQRWEQRVGGSFRASVGLASGQGHVLRSTEGTDELTVTGSLVEDTAALQSEAPGGAIRLDEATYTDLSASNAPAPGRPIDSTASPQKVFQVEVLFVQKPEKSP